MKHGNTIHGTAIAACALLSALVIAPLSHGRAEPGTPASAEEAGRAESILLDAKKAIAAVDSYQGMLVKRERFGDVIAEEWIRFKFKKPFRVYFEYVKPISDREGIYVEGWNDGRVRAHKGSFPDVTVNLDPLGRRAMEDNHHPITSFGLETMLDIALLNLRRGVERGEARVSVSDGGMVYGQPTWRIDARFAKGGRTFTVKPDEDIWSFAHRSGQNAYVILHHNPGADSKTGLVGGDELLVPTHYATRSEYFVTKSSSILVLARHWDQNGRFYESYAFPELDLGAKLDQWDFDPRNKDYGFSDQR